ncbi:MAG: hypothetical protein V3R25_10170 [Nitrosomonadaceae bacterium]
MKRLVQGVGINDADYTVMPRINGKRSTCPFYQAWASMLERCYSPKCQRRWPTYMGCSVVEEWHSFIAFRAWMEGQDWQGRELDKDILVDGNKVYGPDTCVFIDSKVNSLLTNCGADRGGLPVGSRRNRGRYEARCRKDGKRVHLGMYSEPWQANSAYRRFKSEVVREAAMTQADRRVRNSLLRKAYLLKNLQGAVLTPA